MASAVLESLEVIDNSSWGAAPPPNIEEEEYDVLAFELWQRASCPEVEDEVLDIEDGILIPH